MTYRIMLLVELTKLSDMSDNFVVITLECPSRSLIYIRSTQLFCDLNKLTV